MAFLKLFAAIFVCFSIPGFTTPSLEEMTLEEKVGQLLMVHFNGEIANEEAQILIQKLYVGGFIYYNWANGLHSPEQVLNLSASLQKLASENPVPLPLFIAVDQEGGLVARLTKGFTVFPGNRALGMTGVPELAKQCAFAIGQELRAVGINFNLSPVVDVNNNPRNPVIGIRSFGETIDRVIPFAKNAIQGYHQAGIITSLKHFPGHGDVEVDTHQDLSVINKTKKQLEAIELRPFSELAPLADSVMTVHLIVPSIDPVNCATLSKDVLDILREDIGFEGVIITDSLVMEGLLKNCTSIDEAAIRALNAGCDILMLGGKQLLGIHDNLELSLKDVERIHLSLVNAVKEGLVSEQRLDQAVQRILNLKEKYNLSFAEEKENDPAIFIIPPEHQLLANEIATLALRLAENNKIPSPLNQYKIAVFAPKIIQNNLSQTTLFYLGKETYPQFFLGLNPSEEEIQAAYEVAQRTDILIFCSYNSWKNSSQVTFIQTLSSLKKPVIVLSLRDPIDASLFPEVDLILTTFSPTPPSIQAACERLAKMSLIPGSL